MCLSYTLLLLFRMLTCFRASCKSCPKKLTTCSMAARQCTDCKPPEECSPSSSSSQRVGGDVIFQPSLSSSSKLAIPTAGQRRRQRIHHQRQMRLRQQQRRRQNNSTASTWNFRRVWTHTHTTPFLETSFLFFCLFFVFKYQIETN